MTGVTLCPITADDPGGVEAIRIHEAQRGLVASIAKSLREVSGDPALTAYAVHAGDGPPIGFAVLERRDEVGFVLRMVIDGAHQARGLGRALLLELVRRLRIDPGVALVATSHREDNHVMAALCASVGFEPWDTPFEPPEGEVYLALPPG